jgi:hypothetical protein
MERAWIMKIHEDESLHGPVPAKIRQCIRRNTTTGEIPSSLSVLPRFNQLPNF